MNHFIGSIISDVVNKTIKNFNNLSVGDELYWNGLISRFNLDTQDLIQVTYES